MGHNGEAAPRVCVPANEVSVFIGLLCGMLIRRKNASSSQYTTNKDTRDTEG
ncbi:hypothetical protein GTW09_10490 [Alteromonas hispanica]|uniref:Uncharacterized protein n=1 Tax=Alteromonas hispanica TaxID=315421 RepID=A0A6L9MW16_9ALTE|nr:hypothetical protein [Alteromonas hispanica]